MNDKSGLEKMAEWLKEQLKIELPRPCLEAFKSALYKARSLLAEEKAQESLAELADRKKGFLGGCLPPRKHRVSIGWEVCIFNGETTVPFFGSTYPEAEANAREYLNGLEDKK